VSQFNSSGTTVTNQDLIQEEIKRRFNSGNACYHPDQNLLSYRRLSKNLRIRIYTTIILPVVLCGCEILSLTLREGLRLRVIENRVLRRIFGPKRTEVTGEWRKLHNEELRNLYSSNSIIRISKSRRTRWAERVVRMEKRNACKLLVGNPEGKRPLGRPRRRCMDNIKMDLGEIGWGGGDWIRLAEDRDKWRTLVIAAMNLRVPQNAGKLLSGLTTGGFSTSAWLHKVS
jgi:hypothetical protein